MTAQARMVNAGNCTKDKLDVVRMTSDGAEHTILKRGEILDLGRFVGADYDTAPMIKLVTLHDGEYVGEPQILICDLPKSE